MKGKHGQTTSGVTCHHCLWTANTVERRRAWHDITTFGQYTRSDYVGRGMTSPPLDSTQSRTTSGVTCHHRLLTAHSVERSFVWHVIIAVGQHTRSNNVGRGMISPPLDNTHGRQRRAWYDITALGQHTRSAMSGVAFHHRPWTAHTVGLRRAWHDITTFG